jgi:hypothetical protein
MPPGAKQHGQGRKLLAAEIHDVQPEHLGGLEARFDGQQIHDAPVVLTRFHSRIIYLAHGSLDFAKIGSIKEYLSAVFA